MSAVNTLVIAEAGVNHNGDFSVAMQLVDAAAAAGADYIKFQTFSADRLVTQVAAKAEYQIAAIGETETQYQMLKRLELGPEAHVALVGHCAAKGIGFLSTGFDIDSIDYLVSLGIPFIKVPSGEITNLPYLRHAARQNLPIVMSSGMATLPEIGDAIRVLQSGGVTRSSITVLHCTTEYPAPIDDVNLQAMLTIREAFGVAVGYSDHTLGIEIPIAAVALGATVIEKHFTLDSSLPGPDHRASLEPDQLKAMVAAIRNVERALGDGAKVPRAVEEKNKLVARKSLVAASAIRAGEPFSSANLAVKRPGTGISPMRWDEVLGKVAPRDFGPDELIEL